MSNPVRGETTVKIGDVEIVMVATMGGLARLSASLNLQTLEELYRRLTGSELSSVIAAIGMFTTGGKVGGKTVKGPAAAKAAVEALTLTDIEELQKGFLALFAALMRPADEAVEPGKPDAPTL